ncbi:MAG: M20/M25/M40 family metallo-hydrolase [Anaerovoracaceae bacterium]
MENFETGRQQLSPSDQLLRELIRFDTTVEESPEKPAIDYIRTLLEKEGIETETFSRTEERPNLMATIKSENAQLPPLLMYGHIDVVPVEGQKWSEEPFGAAVRDGYIWGRGTLDMKGELAMFITSMIQIKRDNISLPFDLKLLVVSDEEGTGNWGMAYLVRENAGIFDGVKYALGEIGGFSMRLSGKKLYPVMIAEKQFAHLKITATGEGGHGSFSHSNTAMERLCRAVEKLSSQSLPVRITSPVRLMIEAIASALGGAEGMALRLLLKPALTDKMLGLLGKQLEIFKPLLHNNINVTMIEGGNAVNVIPSRVSCHCDVRLVPGCTMEDAIKDIESIIGSSYEIEVVEYDKGSESLDMTLTDELFAALCRKDPEAVPVPLVVTGVTDGRFLSMLGIQTYGFTPMDLPEELDFTSLIHAADERIPAGAVDFGKDVIIDFICNGYAKALED